jgi:hypothetical protein
LTAQPDWKYEPARPAYPAVDKAIECCSRSFNVRLNLPVTAIEQIFGEQQRLICATDANRHLTCCNAKSTAMRGFTQAVAEEVWQQINNVVATVKKTAGDAYAAVTRGRELESISSGLRALVERFNR